MSTTPTVTQLPFFVQTSGGRVSSEIRLGCPDRSAVQGDGRQGPSHSVAAGRGGGAQGTSGQMPAGHRKVTVPTASPRGFFSVCASSGPSAVLGAKGTKGKGIKALASHLIEGKRQETGNRRTSGCEKREQGDRVMEGGQRKPVPGNGLRSVASPTAAFLLLDPVWTVTALCLLSDCYRLIRWNECLSKEHFSFLRNNLNIIKCTCFNCTAAES